MTENWKKALRFAALPGAAKVRFERKHSIENGTPSVQYRLTSVSQDGKTIGDDRDYDLLKAAISPLERLADAEDHEDLSVQLDLENGVIQGLGEG